MAGLTIKWLQLSSGYACVNAIMFELLLGGGGGRYLQVYDATCFLLLQCIMIA